MTISTLVLLGDSLAQNKTGSFNTGDGGTGSWPELLTESLGNLQTLGPVLSTGMRGVWLGVSVGGLGGTNGSEWTQVGSWTKTASTDAFDKAPYGYAWYASGSGNTVTYTRPTRWRTAPVGFAIYWIDYTSGGAWSYSIDGGAWTAMGQTVANDNGLKKFYVPSAVTSTVAVRAATSGGTAAGCLPVGIELFWSDPTVAGVQGVIVHNLGVNGEQLHNGVLATSGDRLAFLDAVTLGTGSPPASTPTLGTVMIHANDSTLIGNTATWATDLTTLYNRASPFGPVGFINPWEFGGSGFWTMQANYRAQTKTTAAGFATPAKVLDIYDVWSAQGWTGNAAATTAGLLTDGTHLSQAGQLDVNPRVFWWTRVSLVGASIGDDLSTFLVGSSSLGATDRVAGVPAFIKAVSVTQTQTPSGIRSAGKILSVTQAQTASLVRSVGKILSVTQTQTRTLTRSVGKNVSVTQTQVPAIARRIVGFHLSTTQTQTPSLVKSAGKILSATLTQTLTTVRSVAKIVSVTQTQTPSLVRGLLSMLTLSVTQTQTPEITRSVGKTLSATLTQTSTLVRAVGKLVLVTQTQTPTGVRSTGKVVSVTQTQTPSLVRSVGKRISVVLTQIPTLTTLSGAIAQGIRIIRVTFRNTHTSTFDSDQRATFRKGT